MSSPSPAPGPTSSWLQGRLCLMMFLQYAVYGIWFPIAARFLRADPSVGGLGFEDGQISWIVGGAGAIGSLAAPFIAGQFADRHFSTERFLAVTLALGGILKFWTAYQTSFQAWLWLSIVYALLFMPTIALTNALAMRHLEDPKRDFPGVRVWGTIAWIAVAWAFPMIWLQTDLHFQWLPPFFKGTELSDAPGRMIDSMKVSGVLACLYAGYCWFALPHTPPARNAQRKLAFGAAFSLAARHRSFAAFIVASLLISSIHVIYFLQTGTYLVSIGLAESRIMPAMALGQIAEIVIMAGLGRMLAKLGFRRVILLGAFCYALRYAVFGTTQLPLGWIIASQFIHGFCFACFYAAGFIYVDRLATPDIRNSTQTVLMLVLFGAGPMLGSLLNSQLASHCRLPEGGLDYQTFWYSLAAIALGATVVLALAFKDESDKKPIPESAP